MSSACFEPA